MMPRPSIPPPPRARAALIVVVLVSLAFTAAALGYFMQKASTDLIAATRDADAHRLRGEAYSALESTLAVLQAFRAVGGSLRSPEEGWGDPLQWTDYQPAEGREVRVTFADESGKIPLARADFETLKRVFEQWELAPAEAERLADALLDWMREGHVRRGFRSAMEGDYERTPLPFRAPHRPLRSWAELVAIDGVREVLGDDSGRLNAMGERFTTTFSRWDYARPNLNAASPEVLAAMGAYSETQLRQLTDFRAGSGIYANRPRRYFVNADELYGVIGGQADDSVWGTALQALRVTVEVRQGRAEFTLSAVIAPPNGARAVAAPDIPVDPLWAGRAGPASPPAPPPTVNYPFTLLEIVENAVVVHEPSSESLAL